MKSSTFCWKNGIFTQNVLAYININIFWNPHINIDIDIFKNILIDIDIFKNVLIDIDIFKNVLFDTDIDIDIFKSDLIDIDIDIDIFKKCRYIDNRYGLSIYRTPLYFTNFYTFKLSHFLHNHLHLGSLLGAHPVPSHFQAFTCSP